jgi:hypothetical protein
MAKEIMEEMKFIENPFVVTTPEDMSAKEMCSLFVDVMSDFPKACSEGHMFLHGPRGCGKSMIFRYLEPDCQMLARKCVFKDLPFLSVYLTVKKTDLQLTDLQRLENKHGSIILNEHFMIMYILQEAFQKMSKLPFENKESFVAEIKSFVENDFFKALRNSGWQQKQSSSINFSSIAEYLILLSEITGALLIEFQQYLKRCFTGNIPSYYGPLCGYLDFFFPLFSKLKRLSFMPSGPIFLLIDDADNLTLDQTKVLNSWFASRTSSVVSIKASTQFKYKTYYTTVGQLIETPHDYSEVNISTIYTSSHKKKYYERIAEIVSKRLDLAKINTSSEAFFPEHAEQEMKIQAIADEYRKKWEKDGRGYRPSDDATRYARPDYIKSLGGTRKATHSYCYAGFEQLVHISSGVIRDFLNASSRMYSEKKSKVGAETITFIDPSIQNDIVREAANELMFDAFDKLYNTDKLEEMLDVTVLKDLENLINLLGGTFQAILDSDRSERRVFSIAFSDDPCLEVKKALRLGIQLGYFHISSIGNKQGTGRTALYVLNRRLAPAFNLDPTSFAGYLFVTNNAILEGIRNRDRILSKIKSEGLESVFEDKQLRFFD